MEKGTLNRQFVSELAFMDQREILKDVLDIYDEMNQIVDIMEMTDKYVPTSQDVYNLHVNTRLSATAEVAGAEVAPVAGATTDIVLTLGSVKPRMGDVMLTPGRYRAYVDAISSNTITVKPVNDDNIAHEAFSGGEDVSFFSNAYGEGSSVEDGYIYPTSTQSNNIQIIKGSFSVTDLEATNMVEVEFEDQPYFMIKGSGDAFNRFRLDVAFALIFGERSKGLTNTATGKNIPMTHGLEKSIREHGTQLPLDITSTKQDFEDDFYAFNRAIDQARGPKEYWMWNGPDVNNFFDDWLATKEGLKAGGILYNSFNGKNGKDRSVQWGFDSFKIWGRTWHKKPLDAFDNIKVTAAVGYSYPSCSMMIPMNKVLVDHNTGMVDRFRIRYKEAPKGQRLGLNNTKEYYEVVDGGLSMNQTNHEMKMKVSWNTWQGAEFTGLEHFAINTF